MEIEKREMRSTNGSPLNSPILTSFHLQLQLFHLFQLLDLILELHIILAMPLHEDDLQEDGDTDHDRHRGGDESVLIPEGIVDGMHEYRQAESCEHVLHIIVF